MKLIIKSIALSAILSSMLFASTKSDIEQLRKEVAELKKMVLELAKTNKQLKSNQTTKPKLEIKTTNSEYIKLNKSINEIKSSLEGNSKSGFQLAGYAAFDWTDTQGENNDFSGVKFAPIFHYQYSNIFQFEGELEITTDNNGKTETVLEYAAGTLFINDYMGIQFGKFMSPLGQFVQNLHPSWINKLPSAPVGFGHDGAAPSSNIGTALRGGLPKLGNLRSNYVVFVANAPDFEESHGAVGVASEGKTTSNNAGKTWGGRFALNPIGGMEVALSVATGEVAENLTPTLSTSNYISRNYDVFGVDTMYNLNSIDLKAEYIQQKVGSDSTNQSTLEGGTWKAWYLQASYQFSNIKLEPVLRYSNFISPKQNKLADLTERSKEKEKSQLAIGMNYLFTNNIILKIAYEYNKDENNNNSSYDSNNVSAQLAFGF